MKYLIGSVATLVLLFLGYAGASLYSFFPDTEERLVSETYRACGTIENVSAEVIMVSTRSPEAKDAGAGWLTFPTADVPEDFGGLENWESWRGTLRYVEFEFTVDRTDGEPRLAGNPRLLMLHPLMRHCVHGIQSGAEY